MLAILLIANALVCVTWGYFFDVPRWWLWQAGPDLLAATFVATTLIGFRYANPALRAAYTISAVWLGVLNFAFFASLACWAVAGVNLAAGGHLSDRSIGLVFYGLAALASLYGLVNAAWVRVTHVTVALPRLPATWEGRTVALITDLHLGHVAGPAFLRRIVSRLKALKPDAVMLSGDLFDGTTVDLERLVEPWRQYPAPDRVFYVTGNHDEFADRAMYVNAAKGTGIRVLENEKVLLDGLQIIGVFDHELHNPDELRQVLRRAQIDANVPSILLAHQPVNLAVAESEGISLQLSGHTHHGQMWPWNGVVRRVYGAFGYGLNPLGKLLVYTSSGVGTWGPPLRVGTKSEIVLIRLADVTVRMPAADRERC